MSDCPIVIFAKAPVPGFAKTRLARAIGNDAAARLASRMLDAAVAAALAADVGPVEVCCAPDATHARFKAIAAEFPLALTVQGDGDLGERMQRAFVRRLASAERTLLIGTDCPALDGPLLRQAAEALTTHDAVFGPATDGGYVLAGLRAPQAALFADMAWSTDAVMAETRRRIQRLGLSLHELPPLSDIDEEPDLIHLPKEWIA